MIIFLNGKFVSEEQATVSVFDRSFCLGDGLFEAVPIYHGKFFLWEQHFKRLEAGAKFLRLNIPFSGHVILEFAEKLLNENQAKEGMLRVQLSRGVGRRGYSIKGAASPLLVMTLHPPRKIFSPAKIISSTFRIPVCDPLSRYKTCSKLSHVLARTEADEQEADEALLLNTEGCVAEATSSNFFWVEQQTVCTPPEGSGALPGVTRALVLSLCRELRITSRETNLNPETLARVNSAFLTSSGFGVREVSNLDGRELLPSPIARILSEAYAKCAESSVHHKLPVTV